MLTYLKLINRFWECNTHTPIGVNATALYFYLLKINYSLGWKPMFGQSDKKTSDDLNLSVNTTRASKLMLKDLGLIDFSSPKNPSKGVAGCTNFSFPTISKFDMVNNSSEPTISNADMVDFKSMLGEEPTISKFDRVEPTMSNADMVEMLTISKFDNIYIYNNNINNTDPNIINTPIKEKNIKTKNPPITPLKISETEKFLESISEDWRPIVSDWLTHKKKEKKQSYKTIETLTAMFKRLFNISGGDPKIGAEIISVSIANNYSGFFKPKNYGTEQRRETVDSQRQSELMSELNQTIGFGEV